MGRGAVRVQQIFGCIIASHPTCRKILRVEMPNSLIVTDACTAHDRNAQWKYGNINHLLQSFQSALIKISYGFSPSRVPSVYLFSTSHVLVSTISNNECPSSENHPSSRSLMRSTSTVGQAGEKGADSVLTD
jgi:hypothetical protein